MIEPTLFYNSSLQVFCLEHRSNSGVVCYVYVIWFLQRERKSLKTKLQKLEKKRREPATGWEKRMVLIATQSLKYENPNKFSLQHSQFLSSRIWCPGYGNLGQLPCQEMPIITTPLRFCCRCQQKKVWYTRIHTLSLSFFNRCECDLRCEFVNLQVHFVWFEILIKKCMYIHK